MGGGRKYSSGVRTRLAELSRGTCYWPGCPRRITVDVDGEPVLDVDLAHVRGKELGSARHSPGFANVDSIVNLILLCKPHHKVIDGSRRDEFSVDLLMTWKSSREQGDLASLESLGSLTEERFSELVSQVNADLRDDLRQVLAYLAEKNSDEEARLRGVLVDMGAMKLVSEDAVDTLSEASRNLLHIEDTAPMLADSAYALRNLEDSVTGLMLAMDGVRDLGDTVDVLGSTLSRCESLIDQIADAAVTLESTSRAALDRLQDGY